MTDKYAGHTPGPWEYRDNCVFSEGRCVARVDWEIRDEVDDANGQLIADAPSLLKALKEIAATGKGRALNWGDAEDMKEIALAALNSDAPLSIGEGL